jgi:proteic killer suppression protein
MIPYGVTAVDVYFRDQKLAAWCADEREAKRRWGGNHRKVLVRVALLRSADTLADLDHAPGRPHALTGDRDGQFAMSLWGSYRLVFEPANEPLPKRPDGGLDRAGVTAVRVLEVVNYHGD